MNIMFLDFDGVVNTPMWDSSSQEFCMNMPYHGFVNNREAVRWIEAFCRVYNFQIVVSSDWRLNSSWRECLIFGGMSSDLILDRTIHYSASSELYGRGHEIQTWINEHPAIENFIILDDDISELLPHQLKHTIHTDSETGFTEWNFNQSIEKLYNGELKNEQTYYNVWSPRLW